LEAIALSCCLDNHKHHEDYSQNPIHSLKSGIYQFCLPSNTRITTLISVGASIGTTESAHAAAIRATFKALGVNLEIVPTSFVSMETRDAWVLKV
jgi:hypothetical protein